MANRIVLVALLSAVLGCSSWETVVSPPQRRELYTLLFRWESERANRVQPEAYPTVLTLLESENPMLTLYRENPTSGAVTEFFIQVTGSAETALPILYHADRNDIPLSLAFALTWVESRYSARAVNANAGSIDRGLWQLNSLSFRDLAEEEFFDPEVSSRHGADYLRRALRLADNDQPTALAIYNAGLARVRRNEIPDSTQRYVRRVREYQRNLEARFRRYMLNRFPPSSA